MPFGVRPVTWTAPKMHNTTTAALSSGEKSLEEEKSRGPILGPHGDIRGSWHPGEDILPGRKDDIAGKRQEASKGDPN